MVRSRSRGCLHGLDGDASAGRIRGDISPVGITRFDTGVDERKRLVQNLRDRFHLLSGRCASLVFVNNVISETS
ncbi:unnamed protein product [Strongylus vulgaris]|uniref:Uncharacterized protein n=1 Tax=Strongylus vulgaris TaxID=40348 RepID=A0A3P7LGT9_STRVU|nr:unnamed protein product [Strongylus vulgaris]